MSNSLVSIIIPCYKLAHFLPDAIRSVQTQTYFNTEIIVVDDGSPDQVCEVTKKFPDVKYLQQKNQGPGTARNTGFHNSKGEYIVFLDADDRLLPDALQTQLSCFEEHPECAFVSGQIRLISSDGSPLETADEPLIFSDHYQTLLQYCYIWTTGVVFLRRNIFEQSGGFRSCFKGTEDWDLYLRITRIHPVYCHPKIVAEHRRHEANITLNSAMMLKDSLATLNDQWAYTNGNKTFEEALARGISGAQRFYGEPLVDEIQKHLERKSWLTAIRQLSVLRKYYPEGFRKHFYPRLCRSVFSKVESR